MEIKQLIEDYQGMINGINSLLEDETSKLEKHILETKRSCFKTFISELQNCESNPDDLKNTNCAIFDVSTRLPLKDIEKKAKEWAKSRSNGDAEQDSECEYDFKMGMIKARNDLSGLNGC